MEYACSTGSASWAIELPALDVLNDTGEYFFARDFLKDRGYKIIIDCLHPLSLPLIDREWLGFDFIKLTFTPSLADEVNGQRGQILKSAVSRIGRERIVLCRLDDELGLRAGAALGITLYQGRLLDGMMANPGSATGRAGL